MAMQPDDLLFDTNAVHAGQRPDPATGASAVPIYETTSFVFDDTDHAAALYGLEVPGHIYSRITNPTVAVLEERVAVLEGGVGAVATASGHAALHLAIVTLMGAGGHIVASRALYGGSVTFLGHTLPRFGITTTFVDPSDPSAFAAAIGPQTRLVFAETIGNPRGAVLDIAAVAAVAHDAGVPLLVDNTFATPVLCRPGDHGADLVLHSATKFLGGHGLVIGGVLADMGKFPWTDSDLFPTLTEPSAAYHGVVYADEFGPFALLMRARTEGLRDFGAAMSPTTAFLILQGIETLPVRMERLVANTRRVVGFLTAAPEVSWVAYPDHPDHPDADLARRLLPRGSGAVLSFGIRGGRDAGRRFIEALRLVSHLANVGDTRTLVIHPASTTHQQLDAVALESAGIGEDLVRLSVGLEDPADVVADLRRALAASQR